MRECEGEWRLVKQCDDAERGLQRHRAGQDECPAHVAPRAMADVIAAGLRGDSAVAEKSDALLAGLHRDLFIESNPIPAKWALARMGLIAEGIRLPLTPLSAAAQPAVLAALRGAGILK